MASNSGLSARGVDRKTRKFGRTLLRCSVPHRSWLKNMWRRFEHNKIYRPMNVKQFQEARLEAHPHDRGALIPPAVGKHSFLNFKLLLSQLAQFSFSPRLPEQTAHYDSPTSTHPMLL